MNYYKLFFTSVIAQISIDLAYRTYVAVQYANSVTCTGSAKVCADIVGDTWPMALQILAVLAVLGLIVIAVAYLVYRLKNQIVTGLFVAAQLFFAVSSILSLGKPKVQTFSVSVSIVMGLAVVVLGILAIMKAQPRNPEPVEPLAEPPEQPVPTVQTPTTPPSV